MPHQDPRIDAFIDKSAPFARPILKHLRKIVHAACPTVEETIKWGMPSFTYHGILCGMAAFKQHCTFGFWHKDMAAATQPYDTGEKAMGNLGRITSLKDLPSKTILTKLIKQAMQLNESGVKSTRAPRAATKKPLRIPADLQAALNKNKPAKTTFQNFSPSHKREYIEWITEAKREETRAKRLAQTIEWLTEGKSRNWKYERK